MAKFHILSYILLVIAGLLVPATLAFPAESGFTIKKVTKAYNGKVWVHIMPWFETPQTNNGRWGIHWTMANRNPDIIDGNGRRQIAAYYYPETGPYASGDPAIVDYQLLLMKYAGVDGVLIDWPGTLERNDYPQNRRNSEAIIAGTERVGLEFGVVYEDRNLVEAGDQIQQAKNDMTYLQNNYFNKPNYIRMFGAPLLLVFGPITLQSPGQWDQAFSVLNQKPTFFTLWYESPEAGQNAAGEYAWIYGDYLNGLRHFYTNHQVPNKIGSAYVGFRSFYTEGGWGCDCEEFTIPVGPDTFSQTLDMAINNNVPYIQLNTWNDIGEGTMIEPTVEFGNQFLNILQSKIGVRDFGDHELELVKQLYYKRKDNSENSAKLNELDQVFQALAGLEPQIAEQLLAKI